MDTLFHMIILAFVFYFVLKHDLKLHHKKALTRGILLAVVAALVGFFLRGVRLEGFQEGLTDEKKKAILAKCKKDGKTKAECEDILKKASADSSGNTST